MLCNTKAFDPRPTHLLLYCVLLPPHCGLGLLRVCDLWLRHICPQLLHAQGQRHSQVPSSVTDGHHTEIGSIRCTVCCMNRAYRFQTWILFLLCATKRECSGSTQYGIITASEIHFDRVWQDRSCKSTPKISGQQRCCKLLVQF